ncbi:hypothetical protein ADL21_29465 [Streptomyces albus subsp. albus]|nr:hypothetical protein ADL21_29465 [Streptomyces albus subsp. albus]
MVSGGVEILGLQWLAKIFELLIGEGIRDRLMPRSSSERARRLALDLYCSLGQLRSDSEGFVKSLRDILAGETDAISEDPFGAAFRAVTSAATSLQDVQDALRELDPQLEIHAPKQWGKGLSPNAAAKRPA